MLQMSQRLDFFTEEEPVVKSNLAVWIPYHENFVSFELFLLVLVVANNLLQLTEKKNFSNMAYQSLDFSFFKKNESWSNLITFCQTLLYQSL